MSKKSAENLCYNPHDMELNENLLEQIQTEYPNARIVAVTKYLNSEETETILPILKKHPNVWAAGENRIVAVIDKKRSFGFAQDKGSDANRFALRTSSLPRKFCHFIGNIQSREIPPISEHCAVVHSLCNLKHAEKFSDQPTPPKCFIQINISGETHKSGIKPDEVTDFVEKCPKNLDIIGISAIGSGTFTESQKSAEFLRLVDIRNHLGKEFGKEFLISAGTSRDYEIALKHGIDVVRIGTALFSLS